MRVREKNGADMKCDCERLCARMAIAIGNVYVC